MPSKGGIIRKRKKLRYLLKRIYESNTDPTELIKQLDILDNSEVTVEVPEYQLNLINFEHNYPNFKHIRIGDPRRYAYKIRSLFGPDAEQITLPENYPVLPSDYLTELNKWRLVKLNCAPTIENTRLPPLTYVDRDPRRNTALQRRAWLLYELYGASCPIITLD